MQRNPAAFNANAAEALRNADMQSALRAAEQGFGAKRRKSIERLPEFDALCDQGIIYSPRSVSMGRILLASRNGLRPISSLTMLLPLVTVLALTDWQSARILALALCASAHQCTMPPVAKT